MAHRPFPRRASFFSETRIFRRRGAQVGIGESPACIRLFSRGGPGFPRRVRMAYSRPTCRTSGNKRFSRAAQDGHDAVMRLGNPHGMRGYGEWRSPNGPEKGVGTCRSINRNNQGFPAEKSRRDARSPSDSKNVAARCSPQGSPRVAPCCSAKSGQTPAA